MPVELPEVVPVVLPVDDPVEPEVPIELLLPTEPVLSGVEVLVLPLAPEMSDDPVAPVLAPWPRPVTVRLSTTLRLPA